MAGFARLKMGVTGERVGKLVAYFVFGAGDTMRSGYWVIWKAKKTRQSVPGFWTFLALGD